MKNLELNGELLIKISEAFNDEVNSTMALDKIAADICDSLDAQRFFMIQYHFHGSEGFIVDEFFEHTSDSSVQPSHRYQKMIRLDFQDTSAMYFDKFSKGLCFTATETEINHMNNSLTDFYRGTNVKTTVLAPVFKHGQMCALVGINDVYNERVNTEVEQKVLLFIARLIEMHFYRHENLNNNTTQDEQVQKLATLGKMTSGIVHEINNPMFVIYGYSSKIEQMIEKDEFNLDKLKEYSSMIGRNVKRINSIITGLQMIMRDSSRDEFEVTCLNKIVNNTLDFAKEKIRLGEINLEIDLLTDELPVECRPGQIVQVLTNLLNNSYDALEASRGERWIKITSAQGNGRCQILVTDSGEALDNDVAQKIMEPFFSTKGPGKGTGLGLSISREILKRHDGDLFIDSDCENVRFVIDLPMLQYE
ncbi:GHKL domain protein [Bacteriovorax sp. BSW11_IV]|uniref:sensor histidine kinase n=1 Tax=Bacteriovorax sp. BSW11_IV TaxID=1353529 RepID=UPI00038A46CD|nr:HAMP domain-containing sensor histidine kinase [Bacteriovorax sp. BSW11_IV]EQC49198.1 GHKL domain protein [Bacteriovorax sp. BSW11_IV]